MTSRHLLAAIAALACSNSALADPAPSGGDAVTDPAKLYEEGRRHYDLAENTQAIASWKQAYLLSSAPLLLFNIGQAWRLSGNCAQANRFYLNYRRAEPHPKNQAELDKASAKCAGVDPATGDPEPAVTLTPQPTPEPPPVAPTPAITPVVPAPLPQPVAPAPVEAGGGGWKTTGIVAASVGGVLLIGSGVYANKAKSEARTLQGFAMNTPFTGQALDTDNAGRTDSTRAEQFLGVGAGLVVVGAGLWLYGHHVAAASHVKVAVIPGYAQIGFSCAF